MAIRQIRKREYDRLLKLNEERITVGVHQAEGQKLHPSTVEQEGEEPKTVAEIAAAHELGIGTARRSWLVDWATEKLTDGTPLLKELPLDFAPELAARAEASITGRIREGNIPPPNSPATIAAKGHGRTLIDTEVFVNSIRARVSPK